MKRPSREPPTPRAGLAAVAALALAVRLVMLFTLGPGLHVDRGQLENLENLVAGRGLADTVAELPGGGVRYEPTARDLPGHGLLVVATWLATGTHSLLPIQLVQVVLDSLMTLLVFGAAARLASPRVALLAATLYAVYLPQAYLSVYVRRDVWVSFAIVAALYFTLRYLHERRVALLAGAGLALAAGVYFRSTLLFLPAVAGLGVAFVQGWRRGATAWAAMTAMALLALLPWGLRNHKVMGQFRITEGAFYQSVWEGFGEFTNPFGAINNDSLTVLQMRAAGFAGRHATVAYDDFIKPKVMAVVREHPAWYVAAALQRVPRALLVNRIPWGFAERSDLQFHRLNADPATRRSVVDYAFLMARENPGFLVTKALDALLLGLAAGGALLAFRRAPGATLLLAASVAWWVASFIPVRIEGRYMVPVHWIYLCFAAVAVAELLRPMAALRWAHAGGAAPAPRPACGSVRDAS